MAGDRRPRHPKNVRRHRAVFDRAHRSAVSRHDEERIPRQDIEKSTVFDLVYQYLGKCAYKDMKERQRNCACNKFNERHARRKDIRGRDLLAATRTNLQDEGVFGDDGRRLRSRADKNLFLRGSRSSSKECIAEYTKAVRDGRKRAKFYVRDALLYGLQSGLLIPTDGRRRILRVSRKLGTFPSRKAREKSPSNIATSDTEYSVRD